MSLSNLTSKLNSACDFCDLAIQINVEPPTETETEAPTEDSTEGPTEVPTDSATTKLIMARISISAKSNPVWCCGQGSPALAEKEGDLNSISALTNAGIDPENCAECCGKAPEDYYWNQNKICPDSKCTRMFVLKNGVLNQRYFFNTHAANVPKMLLNAVINGKLVANFPFLQHYSVVEGNGRRRYMLPDGSEAGFYTGGETLF